MIDLLEVVKDITQPQKLPEQIAFEKHWADVLEKAPEAKEFRGIAEIWFHWGYWDGRLR